MAALPDKLRYAFTPSGGYKEGTLYSLVPNDNVGNFDVERSGVATRVNKDGLIEVVAPNVPRLDYSDGGCPKLLTEVASENLIEYSEDFSGWTFAQEVTTNNSISPRGDNSADEIPNSLQRIAKNSASTTNIDNTFSVYVKLVDSDYFTLSSYTSNNDWIAATFDITNGTITNEGIGSESSVLDTKASIEKFSNGYCRISITNNTSISSGINLQRVDNPTHSYGVFGVASDTYSDGYSLIWGCQVEEQPQATSYIPTNGSPQQRGADQVTNAGDSSTFNSESGVLFADVKMLSDSSTNKILLLDSVTNDQIGVGQNNLDTFRINSSVGGGTSESYNMSLQNRIAVTYNDSNICGWANGIKIINNTISSFNIDINTLQLKGTGGATPLNAKTKSIQHWDYLTDEEMESLTGYQSYADMSGQFNFNTL